MDTILLNQIERIYWSCKHYSFNLKLKQPIKIKLHKVDDIPIRLSGYMKSNLCDRMQLKHRIDFNPKQHLCFLPKTFKEIKSNYNKK